jgi:hypothetical protein
MTPLLLWLGGREALAAAPTNDTFPDATAVTIGFSDILKTNEATTDTDDTQLGTLCGFATTNASVWYVFTSATDAFVQIDVSKSDYSAGIMVGTGTQGNLQPVTCGHSFVEFYATVGTTFYISVLDHEPHDEPHGGQLQLEVADTLGPPRPSVSGDGIRIEFSSNNRVENREVKTSGSYICTDAAWITIFGTAHQKVDRFTISGFINFFESGTCDGTPHPWSAEVTPDTPDNGKFVDGELEVALSFIACREFIDEECAHYEIPKQIVFLGGAGEKSSSAAVPGNQLFMPSITTRK